jgi:hypothetical protein
MKKMISESLNFFKKKSKVAQFSTFKKAATEIVAALIVVVPEVVRLNYLALQQAQHTLF